MKNIILLIFLAVVTTVAKGQTIPGAQVMAPANIQQPTFVPAALPKDRIAGPEQLRSWLTGVAIQWPNKMSVHKQTVEFLSDGKVQNLDNQSWVQGAKYLIGADLHTITISYRDPMRGTTNGRRNIPAQAQKGTVVFSADYSSVTITEFDGTPYQSVVFAKP